ncbi:protein cornichon homolog 4-like isoform X1 [Primulina eburnea]|uniref:protein cornichon homolog 4-like isoform X1 n=1 Tax=Primulina eburnea TaxID=1245227 RepID=UPI003C6BFA99
MMHLFAWLFAFFLLIIILALILYQLMCLTDLEFDYINPYDSASRINWVVWPEFIAEGVLSFVHLTAGHWVMFLMCLPYLYYNIKLYSQRQHLVDVTEIFNQLHWAKKIRLYKLIYLVILLALSIFWMIWTIVEE